MPLIMVMQCLFLCQVGFLYSVGAMRLMMVLQCLCLCQVGSLEWGSDAFYDVLAVPLPVSSWLVIGGSDASYDGLAVPLPVSSWLVIVWERCLL
ncbi:hypothetical protein PoB_006765900 [Plakobranchus ocellatus]|uniref:Secreted protein n=1 Tax=Plakobranchus ocellatus TaxID=259542 RepID=A0AAV4DA95_9GAST|nr:hypothetical protein PoB_006765900 [Plakobranchus ocellatus]